MAEYALPGIFVMGCLVYLMESYVIRCPEQAEWNIRAEILCQNTTTYFCLYNYITYSYEEGCTGPDWDRPGSKRVYARNFNRAPCRYTRYQPIKFVTDGNSDCIFRKSLCTNEGQTLFEAGTTKTDSTCRCDYKQGYAFVTVPRNKCSCRPLEEDCSCYLKKCQEIGYYLSADYECTKNGTKKTVCSLMSENPSEDPHIDMVPPGTPRKDDSYVKKRTYDVAILVSICLFVMIVITVITMYIMLQQRLPRCPCLSTEQGVPVVNVESTSYSTNVGTRVTLQCTITANPSHTSVGWQRVLSNGNTQPIDMTNSRYSGVALCSPSLIIDNTIKTDEGKYVCIATNLVGSGQSQQTYLTVVGNGIRLEETVSGNNEDNQIASREMDEKWKYAFNELKDNIKKVGRNAALKQFKKDLEKWRNEPVKLAVTGKSGVGKSSFINAICNSKPGYKGFATTSCLGSTTKFPTVYEYPRNPKITLHDLPGFGTTNCPKKEYEKIMKLDRYDSFLIFVRNIEENDIEIAKKLKEMGKPFCFVRSKLDVDIKNAKNDSVPEAEVIEKIMSTFLANLENNGCKEAKCFVISNHNQRIGHFNELVLYIQSNLPELKCDVVMFSMFGELSDNMIDSKYKLLKDRLLKVSVTSIGLDTSPVSDMDRKFHISLICKEFLLYHKAFGFDQKIVKDILKDDSIKRMLKASSIIEIQPTDEAMCEFVKSKLKKLRTSDARKSVIIPLIESVVSMWPAGGDTIILLNQVLDSCRDDAQLVYSHIRNVDV